MKMRLIFAGGLLLALSGCATYDYVGGGAGSGYYHGAPSVEYRYPYGYPSGYGPGYYGGGYYGGGYGYGNPYYRPYPNYRPPHNHRPPPRPGNGGNPPVRPDRPDRPRPSYNGGSPWRNMDSLGGRQQQQRPQQQRPSAPPQARPAQAPPPGTADERFPVAEHEQFEPAHS